MQKSYKIYFWITFLVSAVLFFAPITVDEAKGLGLDKLVHVGLFAGLLYLGDRAFSNEIASSRFQTNPDDQNSN